MTGVQTCALPIFSYARDPGGVISRFRIYGDGAPSLVAALYIVGGAFMILLSRYDIAVYAAFPNFLYMGMTLQLAINGDGSWSGFWYAFGTLSISLIAIVRGRQSLVPSLNLKESAR